MAKIALLIGVSDYETGLDGLPSAVHDVTAMQQVLTNPDMGEFAADAVTVLPNPSRQAMEDAIYNLFANRAKEDLVLLYFSGHGVVDDGGEFYFASRFTRKEQGRLVPTTAVAARSVREWLEQSRSQYKVIILDSCFSGAFAKGVKAKDSGSVNPAQFLGGKGTAILTASTSTQYALTQEGFDLSVYTHYLVEGIRTGGADQDDDGFIAMEELHTYASSKVKEAAPAMTPEFYPVREGYKILLAKSPKDDPKLQYRKQVKLLAEEDERDFSFINRHYLDDLQRSLALLPDDATAIETEELEPYRQRRAKVDRYRTVFEGAIAKRYPLTERDRLGLQRLQQLLSLRDKDVTAIELPLLASKQTESKRQQEEQERQEQRAAQLREQASLKQPQASQPLKQPQTQPISSPTRSRNSASPRGTGTVTSPSITRQQFLKWSGFGGGGLVLALIGNELLQRQQSSQPLSVAKPKVTAPSVGAVGDGIKVGVMYSTTGTMAIVEKSLQDATLLALEQINEGKGPWAGKQGIKGKKIEQVVVDPESDWNSYTQMSKRLIDEDKVVCVLGCYTSASRKSVLPVFEGKDKMLYYPACYEGSECSSNIIYTGAAPNQQITDSIPYCAKNFGKKGFFIGSDYIYGRENNRIAKAEFVKAGGQVVGDEYAVLGTTEFTTIIIKIKQAKPDFVLSTLVGDSLLEFYKQYRGAGITSKAIPIMAYLTTEEEIQAMGGASQDCRNRVVSQE